MRRLGLNLRVFIASASEIFRVFVEQRKTSSFSNSREGASAHLTPAGAHVHGVYRVKTKQETIVSFSPVDISDVTERALVN